jgi:hypothetical protein
MEAVRGEIYRAVAGRSDSELLAPPSRGGWSAAEVLDHLRAAEGSLVRALTKFEKGEPTRVPKRAWWYRVPMSPFFWPIRFTAPKLVRPRPRAEVNPGEVLEALRASRRDLLALADRMGEERFAAMIFPHFLLGRFSGVTWFRFLGRHETKHLGQLRRVLSGPKVLRRAPALVLLLLGILGSGRAFGSDTSAGKLLTVADVEAVTGLKGVTPVARGEKPAAGGQLNFADAGGKLFLLLSTHDARTLENLKKTLFSASVPGLGDEAFLGPAVSEPWVLYVRRGDRGFALSSFLDKKGHLKVPRDQLVALAKIALARL